MSHSVSDKVTYWAVRWQLKIYPRNIWPFVKLNLQIVISFPRMLAWGPCIVMWKRCILKKPRERLKKSSEENQDWKKPCGEKPRKDWKIPVEKSQDKIEWRNYMDSFPPPQMFCGGNPYQTVSFHNRAVVMRAVYRGGNQGGIWDDLTQEISQWHSMSMLDNPKFDGLSSIQQWPTPPPFPFTHTHTHPPWGRMADAKNCSHQVFGAQLNTQKQPANAHLSTCTNCSTVNWIYIVLCCVRGWCAAQW